MSVTVGINGAIPITIEPFDVKPEYSMGPRSNSILLFFVSILVSWGFRPIYFTETFFNLRPKIHVYCYVDITISLCFQNGLEKSSKNHLSQCLYAQCTHDVFARLARSVFFIVVCVFMAFMKSICLYVTHSPFLYTFTNKSLTNCLE